MTRPPPRAPAASRPVAGRPLGGRPPGPDPARLARLLVRAWLEVRAGRRPLEQLAPLVAPAVLRRLASQLPPRPPPGGVRIPQVRSVRVTYPSTAACEACVTIRGAEDRTTAVALRLERNLGRWRVVELMAPESGFPPLTTSSFPDGYHPRDAFDEALEEEDPR